MSDKLNIITEATKFADLSDKYAHSTIDADREQYQNQIKLLIKNTSLMVEAYFKSAFIKEKSGIKTGRKGVIMVAPNMGKIINSMCNNTNLNPSRIMRYDKHQTTLNHGAVFLMDYSGSMWFDNNDDTFDGVQRIHMQNFIVLTITHMLQKMNKTDVVLIPFCRTPVAFESKDIIMEDLDLFLVAKEWASIITDDTFEGVPKKLQAIASSAYDYGRWACVEYPAKAIALSMDITRKYNVKNFSYMVFTDGGLSRIGETTADRVVFLQKLMEVISKNSDTAMVKFVFIKTQSTSVQAALTQMGEQYDVFDDVDSINDAFSMLSNTFIEMFNNF